MTLNYSMLISYFIFNGLFFQLQFTCAIIPMYNTLYIF